MSLKGSWRAATWTKGFGERWACCCGGEWKAEAVRDENSYVLSDRYILL